jgi:hypothetical protein
MKKSRFLMFAASLTLALTCGPLMAYEPSSAAAQRQIPPACVEQCRQVLFECIAEGGGHRCLGVYRNCTARCR